MGAEKLMFVYWICFPSAIHTFHQFVDFSANQKNIALESKGRYGYTSETPGPALARVSGSGCSSAALRDEWEAGLVARISRLAGRGMNPGDEGGW